MKRLILLAAACVVAATSCTSRRALYDSGEPLALRMAQSEIARLSLEAAHKLMDKPLTHMYDEFLTAKAEE